MILVLHGMRRYYFNIRTKGDTVVDEEGVPLASVELAIDEAHNAARKSLPTPCCETKPWTVPRLTYWMNTAI